MKSDLRSENIHERLGYVVFERQQKAFRARLCCLGTSGQCLYEEWLSVNILSNRGMLLCLQAKLNLVLEQILNAEVEAKNKQLEEMEKQLEEKNKQLEEKNKQLEEKVKKL